MDIDTIKNAKKVIGAKQTAKAIEKGLAEKVYLAQDADKRVTTPIFALCEQKKIMVETVATMEELGKICSIEVGAAAAAVVKS